MPRWQGRTMSGPAHITVFNGNAVRIKLKFLRRNQVVGLRAPASTRIDASILKLATAAS
jgi:hypothetical protein